MSLDLGTLGVTQYCVLTIGMFTLLGTVLVAISWPWLQRQLAHVEPSRRANLLMAIAAAPLAVGLFSTVLCFLPGALGALWPALDHCAAHEHVAPRLCLAHQPVGPGTVLGWAVALAWLAAVAGPVLRHMERARRSQALLHQLLRASRRSAVEPDVVVLETDRPIAAVTALGSDVLLSQGLISGIQAPLIQVVLEHEREHLRRRDPARRLIAGLLATTLLPHVRRALLAEWELASERACDEAAATKVGDRLTVARALLAVERLAAGARSHLDQELGIAAARFCRHALERRVESLLAPAPERARPMAWGRWTAALFAFSLVAAHPVHHAAEVVLGLLAG